jgi:glyoxylase-like metal-dependent hydrolase (beta-lactamase superfamily II)
MPETLHWKWTVLRAGAFGLDGGSMFGVVPRELWSRLITPDDRNRIPLQCNCVLLRRAGETVLVETGYGDKWTQKDRSIFGLQERTIVDALAEHDVLPADIDRVFVTHLHFDHAGGLTCLDDGGAPTPTFPNARVFVQRQEWEDAMNNRSTMTRTYLRSHLDPIAECVELIDGEATVDSIHVMPVPGHTWGQQMISWNDCDGHVAFPGDVMPTVNHVGLAFSMGYDMLPYTNMETKRSLLETATREQWRVILDHEPGDPVVCVSEREDRPGQFLLQCHSQ